VPILSFFKSQAMPFKIKQLVIYTVSMAIGFAPTVSLAAQKKATEDQTSTIKGFYKSTGYKGGGDIGEWAAKNTSKMHYKMRMLLQRLHYAHPDQKLPQMDFSEFQKDGKTYTRLILKDGKQQQIFDVYKNKDQMIFKKDGVAFSYDDIYYADPLEFEGVSPMLTLDQLQRASEVDPRAAADYQAKFRDFMNAMTVLTNLADGETPKFSYVNFILQTAYASESDKLCVTGGNLTKLGTTVSPGYCGADDKTVLCTGSKRDQFRCNPLVYGFAADGGEICIPKNAKEKPAVYVSRGCNAVYDLTDSSAKEKFVSSILNNRTKLGIDEPADFYKKLQDHIKSASHYCGLPANTIEDRIREGNVNSFKPEDFEKAFPKRSAKSKGKNFDYNEGHRTACSYLMNRLVLTQQAASCSQRKVLAKESPLSSESANFQKICDVAVVAGPVAAVTADTPIDRCEDLQKRSEDLKTEYEVGRVPLSDAKTRFAALESEKKNLPSCTLYPWLPTTEVQKPAAPVIQAKNVSTKEPQPKKSSSNICFANIGQKIGCAIVVAAIACKLLKIGPCSEKSKPAPMPVGKPGEAQGTGSSTTRPAPASPNFVPGAR
jgi:hypothetical protein